MYTKCTQCGIAFEIAAQELKSAQGMVRCGQCRQIFNAMLYLTDEPGAHNEYGVNKPGSGIMVLTRVAPSSQQHRQAKLQVKPQPAPVPTTTEPDDEDFSDSIVDRFPVVTSPRHGHEGQVTDHAIQQLFLQPETEQKPATKPKIKPKQRTRKKRDGTTHGGDWLKTIGGQLKKSSFKETIGQVSERLAFKLAEFHKRMITEEQAHDDGQQPEPARQQAPQREKRRPPQPPVRKKRLEQIPQADTEELDDFPELKQTWESQIPEGESIEFNETEQKIAEEMLEEFGVFDDMDDSDFEEKLWLEYFSKKKSLKQSEPDEAHRQAPAEKPDQPAEPHQTRQEQEPPSEHVEHRTGTNTAREPTATGDTGPQPQSEEAHPENTAHPTHNENDLDLRTMAVTPAHEPPVETDAGGENHQTQYMDEVLAFEEAAQTAAGRQQGSIPDYTVTRQPEQARTENESPGSLHELHEKVQNPFLRAAAVRALTDQELLAEIAVQDPTSIVRASAVERLDDVNLLLQIAQNDDTDEVHDAAVKKLQMLEAEQIK